MRTLSKYFESLFDVDKNDDPTLILGKKIGRNGQVKEIASLGIAISPINDAWGIDIDNDSIKDYIQIYRAYKIPFIFEDLVYICPKSSMDFQNIKFHCHRVAIDVRKTITLSNTNFGCELLDLQTAKNGNLLLSNCNIHCSKMFGLGHMGFPKVVSGKLDIYGKALFSVITKNCKIFEKACEWIYDDIEYDPVKELGLNNIDIYHIELEGRGVRAYMNPGDYEINIYNYKSKHFQEQVNSGGKMSRDGEWVVSIKKA